MRFLILLRKELTEIIRDRRAVISTVVVPLVAAPLFLGVVGYFMGLSENKLQSESYVVALQGDIPEPGFAQAMSRAGFQVYQSPDPAGEVQSGTAVLGIRWHENEKGVLEITVFVDKSNDVSNYALSMFQQVADSLRSNVIKDNMEQLGVPLWAWHPFEWKVQNLAPQSKITAYLLGVFLGYILVLLVFTGCMYPAMDLVAGERERHTIELLLSAPVSRTTILAAKITAVAVAGLTAALINVFSYAISLSVFAGLVPEIGSLGSLLSVSPAGILIAVASAVPLAGLAASIEIAIASWAKSYREAQTYLTPLSFVVILPGIASMMPGAELSLKGALIPIYNTAMVIRTGFMGTLRPEVLILSLIANLAYAAIGVALAVKAFSREGIIKSE